MNIAHNTWQLLSMIAMTTAFYNEDIVFVRLFLGISSFILRRRRRKEKKMKTKTKIMKEEEENARQQKFVFIVVLVLQVREQKCHK